MHLARTALLGAGQASRRAQAHHPHEEQRREASLPADMLVPERDIGRLVESGCQAARQSFLAFQYGSSHDFSNRSCK